MAVLFGILGLLVGSFLNVLILRTKSGESFVTGRSECPKCHKGLAWYELIPVLSYAVQKGRCRGCGAKISPQYPLVELLTGAVFATLYFATGVDSPQAVFSLCIWLAAASLLIAAAVYDLRWMILPDRFMVPLIVLGIINVIVLNTVFDQSVLISRLIAAVVFALFFTTLWLVSSGKWLGDGDIRLAFAMGLLLSLEQLLVAIFFAFNIAAVVAIGLLLNKKKTRHDAVPLGPFLILGTFIGLFFGQTIMNFYLGL
jgi:leader peptidase (prepilin peptidase)/N-methyltransferase